MKHADNRPRIHIRPAPDGARWGTHPASLGTPARSAGAALDDALACVDARRGVVVILEPVS